MRRIALVAVVVALSTTACGAAAGSSTSTSDNTDPRHGRVYMSGSSGDAWKECDGTTLNYWGYNANGESMVTSSVPNSDQCKG